MRRPRILGSFGAATWLMASSAGASQAGGLALEWHAPDGCPTKETVLERIAALSPTAARSDDVAASVVVTPPGANKWNAHVTVRRDALESRRTLTASSCDELVEAVAVVVGLVVGTDEGAAPTAPTAVASAPADVAAPPDVARPKDAPVPSALPSTAPALDADLRPRPASTSSPSRPVLGLAAVGLVEGAVLPGVAYGGGVVLSISVPHLRAEVGAEIFADQSMAVAIAPGTEAHFGFWSLRGGSCWLPFGGHWRPAWCAEVEWGLMSGHADGGTVSSHDANRSWLAVATGPYLEWSPRPSFGLLARADAVLPLTPTMFAIDSLGEVYRPGTLAVRALAGGELRF